MYIPAIQRTLLTDILEAFEFKGTLSDQVLGSIYFHLFGQSTQAPSFSDTNLQEIVGALQDILEAERLTSLEGILAFFGQEDQMFDEYAREISDDIIRAQEQKERDEMDAGFGEDGIGVTEPPVQVKPALSRYVVTASQFKPDEFAQAFAELEKKLVQYFQLELRHQANEGSIQAEDLVQQTAELVWKKWRGKTFEKHSVEQLIFMQAKTVLRDWRKAEEKYCRITAELSKLEKVTDPPDHSQDEAELVKWIRMSLSPKDYNLCILMAKGYSAREIGKHYSMATQTVWNRIYRIRRRLLSMVKWD